MTESADTDTSTAAPADPGADAATADNQVADQTDASAGEQTARAATAGGTIGAAGIRYSRVFTIPQLTAAGLSVSLGLGVYAILGTLFTHYSDASIQASYLLLLLVAVPIALTLADRATVATGSGVYGMVRSQRWLLLPFATGWLLIGGYATLLALLGWGLGLHADILLITLGINVSEQALMMGLLLTIALLKIAGSHLNRRSRTLVVGGAALIALVLAGAGLIFDSSARELRYFLTQDALAIDAAIMTTTTLLGATLWGLLMILEIRGGPSSAGRLRPALLANLGLLLVVAGTGALAIQRYIGPMPHPLAPLLTFAAEGIVPMPAIFTLLYLGIGIVMMLIGLDLVFTNAIRLVEYMADDGYVPQQIERIQGRLGTPLLPVMGTTALALLLLFVVDEIQLVGLSALLFFWTMIALNFLGMFREQDKAYARGTRLPFYPLFPALTCVIGLLLPFSLSWAIWWKALIWIGVGLLVYVGYARRGATAKRRDQVVEEADPVINGQTSAAAGGSNRYIALSQPMPDAVLVAVANPNTAVDLITLGAQLAAARNSGLIILRVLPIPEQTALELRRRLAQVELTELRAQIAEAEIGEIAGDIEVRPLVRLGMNVTDGILDAVENEEAGLLLLGWNGSVKAEGIPADPLVDVLMRKADCDIFVLRGSPPKDVEQIVVATAGGPHAALATELICALAKAAPVRVRLIHVLPKGSSVEEKQAGKAALTSTIGTLDENEVEHQVIANDKLEAGIADGAKAGDLLVLGASKENAFSRSRFRGMPVDIAANRAGPTLIVRSREIVSHPNIARAWEVFADPLPALTGEQRNEVARQMDDSAAPSIDFYVLIILASVIASLGLLQNSAAVIIGAMLVAPLMSPILAMGMAMVRSDLSLLKTASETTAKGIFLAVLVGVVVVLISPIDGATNEILARTEPNILDLMVALASGAAAGYAICRTKVAAALPGVAIAAALVPPLCVVGYGIGSSQLNYAGGATLLFATNLVAIILSAAVVFLALGFYPRNVGRRELWQRLRIPLISLAIISIVLLVATVATIREANRATAVAEILETEMARNNATVQTLDINRQGGVFLVDTTIIMTAGYALTSEDIAQIESDIQSAVGGEVDLQATILSADLFTDAAYARYRQVNSYLTEQTRARNGGVLTVEVVERRGAVNVTTTLIDFIGSSAGGESEEIARLDSAALEEMQRGLEAELMRPVTLDATVLQGSQTRMEPTGQE